MKKTFFPTNNYHNLVRAVEALKQREPSLPGMGLVYGRWGLGKSEAIDNYYGESNIYWIEVDPTWTVRGLLRGICDELRVYPEYRTDALMKQACNELKRRGEPLFIDEADRLFKKAILLDVVRFVYDRTKIPFILVGMENVCGKLQKYGQLWSRILPAGIVEFEPLSPPELILISQDWSGLSILPEGAELLCRYTEGDFRYIVGYLLELEKACAVNKICEVSVQMVEALLKKTSRKKAIADRYRKSDAKRLQVVGRTSV